MKAIIYTKYGTPDRLQLKEMDKPIPKSNEVLVKVHAASINSWDWDLLQGRSFVIRLLGPDGVDWDVSHLLFNFHKRI